MEERERQRERKAKRRETKREGRRYDSGRVMKQSKKDREHGGRPWNVMECPGRKRKDRKLEGTLNELSGMAWKEREHCGKGWNPMEGFM